MRIARTELRSDSSVMIVVSSERSIYFGFERNVKDVVRLLGFEPGIVE